MKIYYHSEEGDKELSRDINSYLRDTPEEEQSYRGLWQYLNSLVEEENDKK